LIDRIKAPKQDAKQTLILAHRRELVEQATRHCEKAYPDKSIDVEMGDLKASGAADITVASVRSLTWDRLQKYDPNRFKLVLVDEAHHIVAPGYLEVLKYFGLYSEAGPVQCTPALVGVSATFSRFDGLQLGSVIDHIVYHKDYVDMIGEKWLSDVMFTTVKSNANLARVRTSKDGDFQSGQLSKAVNTEETNEITVQSWLSEAEDRKSTLVFCVDISHLTNLTAVFRKHGIDARYITGSTRKKERGERLDAFKRGEFPVLINCGVFTEGTDVPNIDCVLLCRPTKSRNLLVQMIGRGMRLHEGKKNCHVIDMVASLETGIVTVPTLFGLHPSEMVKGVSVEDLRELKELKEQEDSKLRLSLSATASPDLSETSLDFTHYESIHDLIGDTSGERHVRAISQNAWVQIDSHKYILAAKGGMLTLERRHPSTKSDRSIIPELALDEIDELPNLPDLSQSNLEQGQPLYHVIWKYNLPPSAKSKSPFSKPRTVATAAELTAGLAAADTFASTKFERLFITTSSSWRQRPASQTQLDFLNKLRSVDDPSNFRPSNNHLGIGNSDSNDDHDSTDTDIGPDTYAGGIPLLTPADLTKGQAADMITKIKFGVRGRFDRMMGMKRRHERAERQREKIRELRGRETVRVGRLEG
jgi:ATP-dependent helicase IRC3